MIDRYFRQRFDIDSMFVIEYFIDVLVVLNICPEKEAYNVYGMIGKRNILAAKQKKTVSNLKI